MKPKVASKAIPLERDKKLKKEYVCVQFLSWQGFIFLQTQASPTDVSAIFQAMADGLQLHLVVLKYTNAEFYVEKACNASRDVVCQQCQTCSAGFYANNTCGVSHGNDRLDTQCAECPADYYCPGGSVSQAALSCPDNGKSAPWSDAIADCTCDPGFYRSGDICVICPLDAYCPRGVSQAVSCPAFRDPPADEEGFNCTLCTPDDYCFNNSLYRVHRSEHRIAIPDSKSTQYTLSISCLYHFARPGCSVSDYFTPDTLLLPLHQSLGTG
jgi:hypothetical protein